jgi:hypothetical protein
MEHSRPSNIENRKVRNFVSSSAVVFEAGLPRYRGKFTFICSNVNRPDSQGQFLDKVLKKELKLSGTLYSPTHPSVIFIPRTQAGEVNEACRILMGKPLGERSFERPIRKLQENH